LRFVFIHAEKAYHSVTALCRVLEVTRQGYYVWQKRPPSSRERAQRALTASVQRIHTASRGTYGSPRILAVLRKEGQGVGKRRVERTMRDLQLQGRRRKRYRVTTARDLSHRVADNSLARQFDVPHPDVAWVTDITYIQTAQGWSYLAAIIDLYSRRVVGWSVDNDLSTELTLRALQMALSHRRPPKGLLHHSDRGCQYTSSAYRTALKNAGIEASMSRKGNCWDNAVAESFFATIKAELISRHRWQNNRQLRDALFDYIEVFYNRQRLHSTLNYETPAQAEHNHHAALAA